MAVAARLVGKRSGYAVPVRTQRAGKEVKQMEALALILIVVSFAGGGGGKAGW